VVVAMLLDERRLAAFGSAPADLRRGLAASFTWTLPLGLWFAWSRGNTRRSATPPRASRAGAGRAGRSPRPRSGPWASETPAPV
jgi:hypothetical protein